MIKTLKVIAGPDTGQEYKLPPTGVVQIGRGRDTLTKLEDLTVSRNHCQVEVKGPRVVLTNSSPSGTLVNEEPITEYELKKNDVIHLGETKIRYEVEEPYDLPTIQGGKAQKLVSDVLNALSGTTLDHFQVGKLLADGIAGPIFRARDTKHNRDVTLKVFLPNAVPKGALSELLRPARELHHPNLVTLQEAGKTGMYTWVAMEYVEGESLDKQLERAGMAGMLDWQHVLRYGIHLASALDVLHQNQVVHRAITPRSILIARSDKQAKLSGLWQARNARDCQAESDMQDVLRNVSYMPPERLRGGQPGTIQGDIYSLGTVLYTLLAGRPPFEGETQAETIAKVVQTEPVAPKDFQLSLPDAFQHAVLRMLAKRPEDRYANAGELLTELQDLAERPTASKADRPVLHPPVTAEPPLPRPLVPPVAPVPPPPVAKSPPVAPAAVAVQAAPAVRALGDGKLVVTCSCGLELQARKQFAGTQVRCPGCGTFIRLPGRTAFGQAQDSPHAAAQPYVPSQPPVSAPVNPPKPAGLLGNDIVRYGVVVALLVLILGVILAGLFFEPPRHPPSDKRTSEPTATQPAKPATPPQK